MLTTAVASTSSAHDRRTRGADLKRWRLGRSSKDGRGLLERFAFSFMGPPQLGQHTVREGYVPDAAALLCHRCSEPWEVHERVHTGSMTYRRCPQD